jgi:hypothetical protein
MPFDYFVSNSIFSTIPLQVSVSLLHIVEERLLCLQVGDGRVGGGQCALFSGVVAPAIQEETRKGRREERREEEEVGRG